MRKRRIQGLIAFLSVLFIICFMNSFQSLASDENTEPLHVLFLSSYSYGWDTVQMQIEGVQDGITSDCVVDYEFMDTKRLTDEKSMELFYQSLLNKKEHGAVYDAVIIGDDAALAFALEYREDLFAGTPLFFEGINDEELAKKAVEDPMIFGILERLFIQENIELARQFVPSLKEVIAVLDNTVTGEAERKRFWAAKDEYPDLEFTEINTSELTEREISRECRNCSGDSVIIFITCTENKDGKRYSAFESLNLITDSANVPVLRMVEAGLGKGIIGGSVTSMYQSGYLAAVMAMDYLSGKEIPQKLVDAPNRICIDEDIVRKYKIKVSDIPNNAMVVNHKPGFSEKNKEGIKLATIPVIMLLCFVGFYFMEDQRRKSMLDKMECLNNELENASEHDFLTQLPNRSKFNKDIEKLVEQKHPCSVFMLDIDDFKKINDTLGHSAGDEALCELARRLKELESESFRAYRLAGDEFITIFRHTERSAVDVAAKKCGKVFEEPMMLHGEKHKITGSVGVAIYPKDASSAEQLMICADKAMYQVKKSGKNSYHFYDPSEVEES